jgi:hypothetical protein
MANIGSLLIGDGKIGSGFNLKFRNLASTMVDIFGRVPWGFKGGPSCLDYFVSRYLFLRGFLFQ